MDASNQQSIAPWIDSINPFEMLTSSFHFLAEPNVLLWIKGIPYFTFHFT